MSRHATSRHTALDRTVYGARAIAREREKATEMAIETATNKAGEARHNMIYDANTKVICMATDGASYQGNGQCRTRITRNLQRHARHDPWALDKARDEARHKTSFTASYMVSCTASYNVSYNAICKVRDKAGYVTVYEAIGKANDKARYKARHKAGHNVRYNGNTQGKREGNTQGKRQNKRQGTRQRYIHLDSKPEQGMTMDKAKARRSADIYIYTTRRPTHRAISW